jgi:hypothetical protein
MSDEYTNILLEEIRDQNRAVLEVVGTMQERLEQTALQSGLVKIKEEIKQDVKTGNAALKATNQQLIDYETRLTKLEQATD